VHDFPTCGAPAGAHHGRLIQLEKDVRMKALHLALTACIAGLVAPHALAHEGHGAPHIPAGPAHSLVEPQHAWPAWILLAAAAVLLARARRVRRSKA
jgi:hypothetical protein